MWDVGSLAFASPWVLTAAVLLPLVWLLLRITPPALSRMAFPAVMVMFGLTPTERTPARTPWWLVALRMLVLILVLLGLARPLLNADRSEFDGPLVLVIDNGWASASQWAARIAAARNAVAIADRRWRPVAVILTAPAATGHPADRPTFTAARAAMAALDQAAPQPWSVDRAAAAKTLAALTPEAPAETLWISDGIDDAGRQALIDAALALGAVNILGGDGEAPLVMSPPQRIAAEGGVNRIEIALRRVAPDGAARPEVAKTVRALDGAAATLARVTVPLAAGAATGTAGLSLPSELANRIARFDVEGQSSAGSVVLADDRWRRRPVGIVAAAAETAAAPLLDDAFYLAQALSPTSEVRTGRIDDLLTRPLSMIAVPSGTRLTATEVEAAEAWISRGGVLVRFAGPRLAFDEPLLPVRIRTGGRSLGGAMSWGEPMGLGAFPDQSPFKTLESPADVKIRTQVLAEPTPDLPDRTWAKLADGTPLVTSERRGDGRIVFFHVAATPDWSNLPLSGLFVGMLQELLDLSQGVAEERAAPDAPLAPVAMLDGFGRLVPPSPTAVALAADSLAGLTAGPAAPPGLYGAPENRFALNLAPALAGARAIASWPSAVTVRTFAAIEAERDLKPWLLLAALTLCLIDFAISLVLRGLAPWTLLARAATVAVMAIGAAALTSDPTLAQPAGRETAIDTDTAAAILKTRLAYVGTGRPEIDRVVDSGLTELTRVLAARTSSEMEAPARIDLTAASVDADALIPFPMLYWRVAPDQPLPSGPAAAALSQYMRSGGMVVFDAPDQVGAFGSDGGDAGGRLAQILSGLDIPPLAELSGEHVLTRSFYLLEGLPGRYAESRIFVARGTTPNDSVSTVVIGGNDWAAAWARDANGLPLFPVIPGGETQRESSYRAGVNMVMYALTGNYKADQVHIPAIMQRLTQ